MVEDDGLFWTYLLTASITKKIETVKFSCGTLTQGKDQCSSVY